MRIIKDFIDPDFIKDVLHENEELNYTSVWKSNLGWQTEIIKSSGIVLIRDLNAQQKNTLIETLVAKGLLDNSLRFELEAQVYLWTKGSFIPWHADKEYADKVRYAATLYLNEAWDIDWGGLFLYEKGDEIKAEIPNFNKLIFNDENFPHATTILSDNSDLRITIQLFWSYI